MSARRPSNKPKKKLPFLTDDELNASVEAVTIKIHGEYFKRGEHRNDVYEEPYEAEIDVPKLFNPGHIKLQSNRYVKRHLNGVRVRTFYVDGDVSPVPAEKKYKNKDFISDMGLQDNARNREIYMAEVDKRRRAELDEDDPDFVPRGVSVQSRVTEDHNYGIDT